MVRAGLAHIALMLAALAGCSHPQVLTSSSSPVPAAVEQGPPAADAGAVDRPTEPPAPELPPDETAVPATAPPEPPMVWGVVGLRAFGLGDQVAPNGVEYNPLFCLDFNFNLWVYRPAGVYLFSDSVFWGQKAAPGQTNPAQGVFDFSKRELDFDVGTAWNYYGFLEARAFAYSDNNLNRGTSPISPKGFKDGIGLENRLYVGLAYADLGTPAFDVARATFVSLGYYPTKDMVDGSGVQFKPGPFARAYLTYDLLGEKCYLYADVVGLARRSFTPELLSADAGLAVRPIARVPRLEFRLGAAPDYYLPLRDLEYGAYGQVQLIY
jgi:hypothetical protein